jgi:hypothetical protein
MQTVKWVVLGGVIVLCLSGSFSQPIYDSFVEYPALLTAPSCVPPEEAYVHIGGGFFSVFESRVGKFGGSEGSVILRLRKLYHSSRFCYRPEGEMILRSSRGGTFCFSMERLDYVEPKNQETLFYRLRLFPKEGCRSEVLMACLICSATVEASPKLTGTLYIVMINGSVEVVEIRITGRSENQADKHLHKVIAALTVL